MLHLLLESRYLFSDKNSKKINNRRLEITGVEVIFVVNYLKSIIDQIAFFF